MNYPKPPHQSGCKFLSVQDVNENVIEGYYMFECPGCNEYHFLNVDEKRMIVWDFNFDFFKPTVKPSILVRIPEIVGSKGSVCHFFITDGKIEYLTDCTHYLAGKTVDMIDVVKI